MSITLPSLNFLRTEPALTAVTSWTGAISALAAENRVPTQPTLQVSHFCMHSLEESPHGGLLTRVFAVSIAPVPEDRKLQILGTAHQLLHSFLTLYGHETKYQTLVDGLHAAILTGYVATAGHSPDFGARSDPEVSKTIDWLKENRRRKLELNRQRNDQDMEDILDTLAMPKDHKFSDN